jgi:hypothetical protein
VYPEPIHVYGSWLHAHEIGQSLWTDHIRDGEKIGEVGRHDPYDFGRQHVEPLDVEVRPGDSLVTHCIYDSSDRTEPTLGGEGTGDEMCLNFVYYYPGLPLPWQCNAE